MADRISIDPDDLRDHQTSMEATGNGVIDATQGLRARTAEIKPAGQGGVDAEIINAEYYEAAQGMLDATTTIGELLVSLGNDIGRFAEASEALEAARVRGTFDLPPYPSNGDPKLWIRRGSVVGEGGGPVGPVVVT